MQRTAIIWGVVFIIGVAAGAWFRLVDLDGRLMHHDEANQAHKAGVLLEEGVYEYDPVEHHGPTLYYLTLPVMWLTGASTFAEMTETGIRLVPAIFGILLLVLLWPYGKTLGRGEMTTAVFLAALSPSLVYYSRYYIQEMLLVFFTFAAVLAGWQFLATRHWGWAVAAGVSLGLMHATKETCAIIFAAMAGAIVFCGLWAWLYDGLAWKDWPKPSPKHIAWGALAGLAVSVLFFSSFLTHPRGVLDSVLTYFHYVDRAGDQQGHIWPWHFYLEMLTYYQRGREPAWTEAITVALAAVGLLMGLFRKGVNEPAVHLHRFLGIFTLLLIAAFSLIPYKTPWNMLVFVYGLAVVGGLGAGALVRLMPVPALKGLVILALIAPMAHLGVQSHRTITEFAEAPENPYAYGHTGTQFRRLLDRIDQVTEAAPEGRHMLIRVVEPEGNYWPLPWYLREYPNVGYWQEPIDEVDAAMIITHPELEAWFLERAEEEYHWELQPLRPGAVMFQVFIRQDIWDAHMENVRAR